MEYLLPGSDQEVMFPSVVSSFISGRYFWVDLKFFSYFSLTYYMYSIFTEGIGCERQIVTAKCGYKPDER